MLFSHSVQNNNGVLGMCTMHVCPMTLALFPFVLMIGIYLMSQSKTKKKKDKNIQCTVKMNLEHIVLHAIMSHAYCTKYCTGIHHLGSVKVTLQLYIR